MNCPKYVKLTVHKDHVVSLRVYEISRLDKSIAMESGVVVV